MPWNLQTTIFLIYNYQWLSEFSEQYWPVATHLMNTKKVWKNTKGIIIIICVSKISIDLFNFDLSYHRTAFFKSRRVERHPYWHSCMPSKITCTCELAKNCICYACNYLCMQFCLFGFLSTRLDIRNNVLCIFSNFLCIYKNGWSPAITAPKNLIFFGGALNISPALGK